jgi:hypothetical protein
LWEEIKVFEVVAEIGKSVAGHTSVVPKSVAGLSWAGENHAFFRKVIFNN